MKNRKAEIAEQIAEARDAFEKSGAHLPPGDPDYDESEEINERRSGWAEEAIVAFVEATGSDLEDAIADLIGDLGHFCDRHKMNMQAQVERGREFYDFETQGEGKAFDAVEVEDA